jgi:hypothetical protein
MEISGAKEQGQGEPLVRFRRDCRCWGAAGCIPWAEQIEFRSVQSAHDWTERDIFTPRHANAHDAVSTQPLATYSERLLEVRRDFTLYDDRVVVQARWFPNRRFEHVVKLDTLKREFQEITIRYRMYRYVGWILAVGALAYAACFYYGQDTALRTVGYVALGVAICGAVFMALTYPHRRIRFARFPTQGGRIGLDIGSAGNDIAAFEKFVQQVRRQIR